MVFKTDQIHPKSETIGLLFYVKSMVFKSDDIAPKSKAIGLPFLPKINGFQKCPNSSKK